ncbi:CC_3452 family protein [Altererythrobacter sp. CAU 1778]
MILPLPTSGKLALFVGAALYTVAGFGALTAPVEAQAAGAHYSARLQQPVTDGYSGALADTYWQCKGTDCSGLKGSSSAVKTCARLAKRHGAVESFAVQGEALDDKALAKCNAAAR